MEDNPNKNTYEDLSWALQIGDLDTVKEQLQRFVTENSVIILYFSSLHFYIVS